MQLKSPYETREGGALDMRLGFVRRCPQVVVMRAKVVEPQGRDEGPVCKGPQLSAAVQSHALWLRVWTQLRILR